MDLTRGLGGNKATVNKAATARPQLSAESK